MKTKRIQISLKVDKNLQVIDENGNLELQK